MPSLSLSNNLSTSILNRLEALIFSEDTLPDWLEYIVIDRQAVDSREHISRNPYYDFSMAEIPLLLNGERY